MQGDSNVIGHLNRVLRHELTTINQLFLHARMLEDWGLDRLGSVEYGQSIANMKFADALIQRILFLEGLPNLQDLGRLLIGEDVAELLECDLKAKRSAHDELRGAIRYCELSHDFPSRDLLRQILCAAEAHIDFIEVQRSLIAQMGLENYQQAQIEEATESGS